MGCKYCTGLGCRRCGSYEDPLLGKHQRERFEGVGVVVHDEDRLFEPSTSSVMPSNVPDNVSSLVASGRALGSVNLKVAPRRYLHSMQLDM